MPETHYQKLLSSKNDEKCTLALELAKDAISHLEQVCVYDNCYVREAAEEALKKIKKITLDNKNCSWVKNPPYKSSQISTFNHG